MKKAIIAVASAAFSTGLLAQVQVYGVMDQAVRVTDGETSQVSGSYNTSRLGVRGTEDLGNGLTVSFTLEGKLDANDGGMGGDDLFSRESSVSIGSKTLGTITLGRTDTSDSQAIDWLATGSTFGNFAQSSGVEYTLDRANTVRYSSPNIGGAVFKIGQSEASGSLEKVDSASITFANSVFKAGVGYDRTASGDTFKALGANVNIAGASVGAMYGVRDAANETKFTVISGRVPMGAFAVLGAYSLKDAADVETKVTTVGASYDLSKRTMILAVYQDREAANSDFFQVGVKHSF